MDFNDQIDNVLNVASSKSTLNPSGQISAILENVDLNEKEKEVFYHIANNPNTTIQDMVNAFEGKPGYSRVPILHIIKQLKENNKIIIKSDKTNSSKYRLSINKEDILASLLLVVNHFKEIYFVLIDKIKSLFINDRNGAGRINLGSAILVECLVMLYKCGKNSFADFFLWYGKVSDNYTHYKKFVVIYNCTHEIHTKLYQMLTEINFIKDDKGMVRLIYHSRSDALRPENLKFIMQSCKNSDLGQRVEIIIDFLWRISYQKLPLMYSEYESLDSDRVKDWRNII